MNTNTYHFNECTQNLTDCFTKINDSGATSIKELETIDPSLINDLHLSLYDYICNKAYNTKRTKALLTAYKEKYGDADVHATLAFESENNVPNSKKEYVNKVVGLENGDHKHDFYLKMFSPISKGVHKGQLWIDVLISEKDFKYWIPTIMKSAENGILSDLREIPNKSTNKPVKDDDDSLTVGDRIESSDNTENEAISRVYTVSIIREIITTLYSKPDELMAYSYTILNNGLCKSKDIYNIIINSKNSRTVIINVLKNFSYACEGLDISPYLNMDFNYERIDRLLTMPPAKAPAEISRCAERAKKRINKRRLASL